MKTMFASLALMIVVIGVALRNLHGVMA